MDAGGPGKRAEESTIEVPSQGGGPPSESKEPQQQAGPNPELADDKAKDELVSGCASHVTSSDGDAARRAGCARDAAPTCARGAASSRGA